MATLYRGSIDPAVRDTIRTPGQNGITITADAALATGYAYQFSGITGQVGTWLSNGIGYSMVNGDTVYCRQQIKVVTVGSTTPQRYLWINGTAGPSATWTNTWNNSEYGVQMTVASSKYNAQLHVRDGNGNESDGVAQALTTGTVYDMEWSLTKDSNTQITMRLYLDGTLVDTKVHTAAGGVGTIAGLSLRNGVGASSKGEGIEIRGGWAAVKTDSTSATATIRADNPTSVLLLPTGDGGTTQWLTAAAATGTYTEWDDAFNSYSAADYNHSGTTSTSAFRQISTMADGSFGVNDMVWLVQQCTTGDNTGTAVLDHIINIGGDITTNLSTEGEGTDPTKTKYTQHTAKSGGGAISGGDIAGITCSTNRQTGSATDWKVYALWMQVVSTGYRPKSLIVDQAVNRAAVI